MIPAVPLDKLAPLQLGDDIPLVCNGRVVTLKSVPREEVRARGFTD